MSSTPTFSMAYTSVRPTLIPQVVKAWNDRSTHKSIEWCISVDDGNEACIAAVKALPTDIPVKLVINKGRKNCVDGWNAAAEATTGKVIIAVSDDFLPPNGWDTQLLSLSPQNWIDGEHVVHINDGFVKTIFTLAILTRKRYERYGYMWYPGYESMFVDTEFGDVAMRDGVVIEAMHLLFEHLHHACGKRPKDTNDANHDNKERWTRGELLYNFRKGRGFPVDLGPKAVKTESGMPKTREYVAYLQVTKDDFCLFETCERLFEEGVKKFYFAVPSEYWDGRKTDPADIAGIKAVTDRVTAMGAVAKTKIFKVPMYRMTGDTRIDTETRLRNDSLAWIRADGHQDILIVDGDELWMPGTLREVDDLVSKGHLAISTAMIPVCGLPGYPVDAATDLAVVYIGGQCQFKACRTPVIKQTLIHQARIIHFTGTRRTMKEIVDKHRASGHYDDPDYDFEGWLTNILPNIKPGLENVHMYKKYQIWPRIREWRPEEVAIIPKSLHPYLPFGK